MIQKKMSGDITKIEPKIFLGPVGGSTLPGQAAG